MASICLTTCWEAWGLTVTELCVSDTEDASETDLAKHNEDDYVELKEQWVENLTSLYSTSDSDTDTGSSIDILKVTEHPKGRRTLNSTRHRHWKKKENRS